MQEQLWNAGPVKPSASGWRRGSQASACRQPGCTNLARAKQGARYCDEHARSHDYVIHNDVVGRTEQTCACCQRPFTRWRQTRAASITIDVCPECVRNSPLTLRQLQAHNVPPNLQRQWLAQGPHLACELCGRTLHRKSHPVVDHDHHCCPGSASCGQCVRGIICQRCNSGIGGFERMAQQIGFEKCVDWIRF